MSFAERIDDPSLRELTTEELASKVEGLRYLLSLAPENKEELVRRITQLEQRNAELVVALEKIMMDRFFDLLYGFIMGVAATILLILLTV